MANFNFYDVLLKPVISEKSMQDMANKRYTFLVKMDANKVEIKEAVEKLFPGTKVAKVNTSILDGKVKRRGFKLGKTNAKKKAIVTLTKDSKEIEIYSNL